MVDFEEFKALVRSNRSYRRFDHSLKIEQPSLEQLVALTQYCGSGRNLQPLRYRIVTDEQECEAIYPYLKWAGYYTDWDVPVFYV